MLMTKPTSVDDVIGFEALLDHINDFTTAIEKPELFSDILRFQEEVLVDEHTYEWAFHYFRDLKGSGKLPIQWQVKDIEDGDLEDSMLITCVPHCFFKIYNYRMHSNRVVPALVRMKRTVICRIPRPIYPNRKNIPRPVANEGETYRVYQYKKGEITAFVKYRQRLRLPPDSFEVLEMKVLPIRKNARQIQPGM